MSFPTMAGAAPFSELYADPTTVQHAAIGSLAMDPLGGLWRYMKAGAAITNPLLGCGSYSQPKDGTPSATAIGSWTLVVTETTCTKDQYANGTIIIGAAAAYRRFYLIKSNTASNATSTTLTLYSPITYTVAGTEWATMTENRFRDVRHLSAGATLMSVCCMPLRAVASGSYCWAKVRGETYGVVSSTVPGAAANDRQIVFQGTDGALIMADEAFNAGDSQQLAGWLIPRTGSTYAGGDQTFWLQIE